MPSFDVVCEPDMIEVKNALEQANKEISTRFDFKGSDARIEQKGEELSLFMVTMTLSYDKFVMCFWPN